jgi:phosphate transport system substrate-binding protein
MTVKGMVLNRYALAGAAALAVASMGVSASEVKAQTVIKIDGSSTVYPITEKVAEGFQKSNSAKVTVGISGTGGGFKKFCAGETDISNASRPIKKSEIEKCAEKGIKYIELPVAIDALTVVINKQNSWAETLTVEELKKIWEPDSQVKKWSDVRAGFPNAPIKLFGPGADSGTFDYFTAAIVGKERASRKDYTPSEDDNVLVQGVSRDKNALGYFGYAYYKANKARLKAVKVNGVLPSDEDIDNGTYKPLARTIYIYVKADSLKKPEVKSFVEYYLKQAPTVVAQVGYHPLKKPDYEQAMKDFKAGKTK